MSFSLQSSNSISLFLYFLMSYCKTHSVTISYQSVPVLCHPCWSLCHPCWLSRGFFGFWYPTRTSADLALSQLGAECNFKLWFHPWSSSWQKWCLTTAPTVDSLLLCIYFLTNPSKKSIIFLRDCLKLDLHIISSVIFLHIVFYLRINVYLN